MFLLKSPSVLCQGGFILTWFYFERADTECWNSRTCFAKVVVFLCDLFLKELIQSAEIPERTLPRWLYSYVTCFWKSWYRVLKFSHVLCQGGCILMWLVFWKSWYRVGIKGSWFVNHESISWSHEPKIRKTSIFHESFFSKYDNFKLISVGGICLSICLELTEWDWLMK